MFRIALNVNPTLQQAALNTKVADMRRKISWANVVPSITLFGGISSSYYKELHSTAYPDFRTQFNNNFGSYVGISMSIPIFNRLSGVTSMRQAKTITALLVNNMNRRKKNCRNWCFRPYRTGKAT